MLPSLIPEIHTIQELLDLRSRQSLSEHVGKHLLRILLTDLNSALPDYLLDPKENCVDVLHSTKTTPGAAA